MQCAEPVTGSSATPWDGAKKRLTKSQACSPCFARSGNDHRKEVDLRQQVHVGLERADLILGFVDHHVIARGPNLHRVSAQSFEQRRRCAHWLGAPGREVESQHVALACHLQFAAARLKGDGGAARFELLEDHPGGCERRVTAQVYFDSRREPAQVVTGAVFDDIGRLAEVVLHCDRLHRRVRQPCFQRADGGRVAGEGATGESVDLINRDLHASSLRRAGGLNYDIALCPGPRRM